MTEKPPSKYGENFSKWFDWVIEVAEIYDYGRYPVKGVGVWRPYGFKLRQLMLNIMRRLLDETGHEEVLLPLLIPENIFRKESEHVRGFEGEVLWVTRGGFEELDIKLALRPTSETAISYMESFWLKSYRQLPKKYYQVASIFRYETKATKPMLRVREVTTFKEAHTVHESFEDAERQVKEAIEIYSKFFDELGIPYLISKRPDWDKFAGALYSIAFDTLLPDGRALQIGTVHHLGQTFAKVFEVRIQKRDETIDYAWQTSYGISERVIASIIAIHGDERGLILPPNVAPIQIVIVPIPGKDIDETSRVLKESKKVYGDLKRSGFRVRFDDRMELRPVEKYFEWEIKGVPVRVEIGPKELAANTITLFRRDLMERIEVNRAKLIDEVEKLLNSITINLKERAWKWFREHIFRVSSIDEAKPIIENRQGIAEVPWCGKELCGLRMSDETGGRTLGSPINGEEPHGKSCVICGKPAITYMRIAKTY
ncbi:MAG: proline--tRNA ligase [Thermoprotei archaeon]|nr:MAG: proline--tRNA ligase [Thermoprotei archaeon]